MEHGEVDSLRAKIGLSPAEIFSAIENELEEEKTAEDGYKEQK